MILFQFCIVAHSLLEAFSEIILLTLTITCAVQLSSWSFSFLVTGESTAARQVKLHGLMLKSVVVYLQIDVFSQKDLMSFISSVGIKAD